ncbi:MAG TPA: hypothetical protein VGN17_31035 [Bryobacteraceae bacterium]|jgi:hypothetical protein
MPHEFDQFNLGRLMKSLKGIESALTEIAKRKTDEQSGEYSQPHVDVRVELQAPEEARAYYRSKELRQRRFPFREWLTIALSVLTLVAVGKYTWITHQTLELMRKQMRATQAAYIVLDSTMGKDGSLTINVKNSGHGFAGNVRLIYEADRTSLSDGKIIEASGRKEVFYPTIGIAGEGLKVSEGLKTARYFFSGPPDVMWDNLQNTKETVKLQGTLTYDDGFESITEPICSSWLGYVLDGGLIQFYRFEPCESFDGALRALRRAK